MTQISSHTIELKNEKKVFFPENDITKGELIEYYHRISDTLLPFLKSRPLSLERYPDGINKEGFYQKELPDYFPDWIDSVSISKKEDGTIRQAECNNVETLVYLVNQGTISLHPWLSTSQNLYKPNKLVFDLDPPEGNFEIVVKGANALRNLLENELGLNAFVMTTGSKGLHVCTPIYPDLEFEKTRHFAKQAADLLANQYADTFTTETRKNKRKNRLFIDYLRNAYAQTSIAPYSVRAIEGATVATPLDWDELSRNDLHGQRYTIKNIFKRLSRKADPWKDFKNHASSPVQASDRLKKLKAN